MNILATNNTNFKYQPSFNSNVLRTKTIENKAHGLLSRKTTQNLDSIKKAYLEIQTVLAGINLAGIQYIQENYPDITIGESLIFHNCGDEKSSILMRIPESCAYSGLCRIIERKGNSNWSERIIKNSFLIENNNKLLKNENENRQKSFPKERNFLTEKEIKEQNLEENLENTIDKLDFAMLKFRKFLNTIGDSYKKTPVGVIDKTNLYKIKEIQEFNKTIDNQLSQIPKKVDLSLRKSFPNYKFITGLTTHAFEKLGDEKVTITFMPLTALSELGLNRLNIFNEENELIKTFVVTSNGKMIANINQNSTTNLPPKIVYFDAKELELEENKPLFEKYLNLYHQKLKDLSKYVENFSSERLKNLNATPKEIDKETIENINKVYYSIEKINEKLSTLNKLDAIELKKKIPNLIVCSGKKGISFNNFDENKIVSFDPVISKKHNDLIKITITNPKGKPTIFLIKDFKYVVKNINPDYPNSIPPTLIFYSEADNDIDPYLSKALEYLEKNISDYNQILDNTIATFNANPSIKRQRNGNHVNSKKLNEKYIWYRKCLKLFKEIKTELTNDDEKVKTLIEELQNTIKEYK